MSGVRSKAQIRFKTVTVHVSVVQLPNRETKSPVDLRSSILWQIRPCFVTLGWRIGVMKRALGAKFG